MKVFKGANCSKILKASIWNRIFLVLFSLVFGQKSPGQVTDDFGYRMTSGSELFGYVYDGREDEVVLPKIDKNEFHSNAISIGFNFKFYEETYSSIYINKNGSIHFEEPIQANPKTEGLGPGSFPNDGNDGPMIAGFWSDLVVSNTVDDGEIFNRIGYRVTGQEPNRKFIVHWDHVGFADPVSNGSSGFLSFQIHLYESTHAVEVHHELYGEPNNDGHTRYALVGIQNSSKDSGLV